MKILTVCVGGRVRSVCLARELEDRGHDAFAVGWKRHGKAVRLGCQWADKVICVNWPEVVPQGLSQLVEEDRLIVSPIGKDIWNNLQHPQLRAIVKQFLDSVNL